MPSSTPKKIKVKVNTDTADMDDVALHCRSFGHLWRVVEPSLRERYRQINAGQVDYPRVCENGCGCTWTVTYSVPGFRLLESKRTWPTQGYKMPAGNGRLSRRDAIAARFARQYPNLAT